MERTGTSPAERLPDVLLQPAAALSCRGHEAVVEGASWSCSRVRKAPRTTAAIRSGLTACIRSHRRTTQQVGPTPEDVLLRPDPLDRRHTVHKGVLFVSATGVFPADCVAVNRFSRHARAFASAASPAARLMASNRGAGHCAARQGAACCAPGQPPHRPDLAALEDELTELGNTSASVLWLRRHFAGGGHARGDRVLHTGSVGGIHAFCLRARATARSHNDAE